MPWRDSQQLLMAERQEQGDPEEGTSSALLGREGLQGAVQADWAG